ncbi:MAG: hypothetical protein V7739_14805 [Motiliproteus sp.]
MNVICKTNEAFEDSLTSKETYNLIRMKNASLLIVNDLGEMRWYGANRFELYPQLQQAIEKAPCTTVR